MRLTTRNAANLGLLTAISIVLTRIFGVVVPVAGVGALRLSFGEIPIILAGVLFGPAGGALTGLASDLIGYIINSHGGAFFPGFTLSAALTGFLPGWILFRHRSSLGLWQVGATVLLTDLIAGVLLNTLWLTILYGQGFFVILPMRVLARLVTLPIYTVTVFWISRAYQSYRRGAEH
ncbi:MAG: folate family ECF transporter S component [Bacillota bacterium]|jgi:ECF transporter S component (folate family)|nr:folate family ECF transporter S component [Bacillota bacterium]NLJ02905.1 folate family ECF transporter S component [Bacillota bacterium]